MQSCVKFYQLFLNLLSGNDVLNEILLSVKSHKSVTIVQKIMCNYPNLLNINAFTKFRKIISICSQDIERKLNYDGHNDGMTDIPIPA